MIPEPPEPEVSRRAFLRRGALGGLTVLGATLAARQSSGACVNEGVCPGCPVYGDCDLPQATARKRDAQPPTPTPR